MDGIPTAGRIVALDFGAARTGVGVTDESQLVASAREPVVKAATSAGMVTIANLITELQAVCVVVGLPTGLSGDDTAQTQRARSFAARLRQRVEVPVEMYDERFTTRMADATARLSGSQSSRDSLAACHLLESWLEARRT
ncbi:MAG: Holliday junction resolvase RuvX [Thermoleophilia bacterium]|nr:Holliday junction resolvase RuvX [Thermoleophilia bacterium]